MPTERFSPSTNLQLMFNQLEFFCEERNRKELQRGIRYLSEHFSSTPRVLNRCLDWYWRSGMLQEGLKLAAPSFEELNRQKKKWASAPIPLRTLGAERALYYLVFLGSLSGLPWVERWLEREEPFLLRTPRDSFILASIWMACGHSKRALQALKQGAEFPSKRGASLSPTETRRSTDLIRGYIYYSSGHYPQAILAYQKGLKLIDRKAAPLLFWDTQSMIIVCEAHVKDPAQSLRDFQSVEENLQPFLERAPRIATSLMARKTLLLAMNDRKNEARALKEKVDLRLRQDLPDYTPERRVNLLFQLAPFDILTPEERLLLWNYPASPITRPSSREAFRAGRLGTEPTPAFDPIKVSRTLESESLRISSQTKEYQMGPRQFGFGVPLEIELLAFIRRAHPYGLHRNLAMALLWPDQGIRIRELENRLSQLIQRLRKKHRFQVQVERECLFLSEDNARRVHVDQVSQRPLALELHPPNPLKPLWVAEQYQVGLTQARKILKEWMERGWVKTSGQGAHTLYVLL